MIIAVLDIPNDDTAHHFIVDLNKLDQADPEQKAYRDAIFESINDTSPVKSGSSPYLMSYHSSEWRHALVDTYPVEIDGIATVWEKD